MHGMNLGCPSAARQALRLLGREARERQPFQLLPALSAEEVAALRADISAPRHPGTGRRRRARPDSRTAHHRRQIAAELGIPCPQGLWPELDEDDKRAHAVAVNVHDVHCPCPSAGNSCAPNWSATRRGPTGRSAAVRGRRQDGRRHAGAEFRNPKCPRPTVHPNRLPSSMTAQADPGPASQG